MIINSRFQKRKRTAIITIFLKWNIKHRSGFGQSSTESVDILGSSKNLKFVLVHNLISFSNILITDNWITFSKIEKGVFSFSQFNADLKVIYKNKSEWYKNFNYKWDWKLTKCLN